MDGGLCGNSCGGPIGPVCCGVYRPWPVGGRGRELIGSSSKNFVEGGLAAGAGVVVVGGVFDGNPVGICDDGGLT